MGTVAWMNLPYYFRPPLESCSGGIINRFNDLGWIQSLPPDASLCSRVRQVGLRILAAFATLCAVVADLALWSIFTITVYLPYKVGCNHVTNLVSYLALPILLFAMPFGYAPKPINRCILSNYSGYLELKDKTGDEETAARMLVRKDSRHINDHLFSAIIEGDTKAIEVFVKEGRIDLNNIDNALYGRRGPILSLEMFYGFPPRIQLANVVKTLIKLGADPNKTYNRDDYRFYFSPLLGAVQNRMPDVVKVLLEGGANPNGPKIHKERVKQGLLASPLIATVMGHDTLTHDTVLRIVENPQWPHAPSLESSKSNIHALIEAEADCKDSDLLDALDFVRIVNERRPQPNERINQFQKLKDWTLHSGFAILGRSRKFAEALLKNEAFVAGVKKIIEQRVHERNEPPERAYERNELLERVNERRPGNPYRRCIIKLYKFIDRSESANILFPGTSPWDEQHILKIVAANIEALAPTVFEAKRKVIGRRTAIIAALGYFPSASEKDRSNSAAQGIPDIISRYVYC